MDELQPQLAREMYNVDSDDDLSHESLEILPPMSKQSTAAANPLTSTLVDRKPKSLPKEKITSKISSSLLALSDSSDDSGDELLNRARSIIKRKPKPPKPITAARENKSSNITTKVASKPTAKSNAFTTAAALSKEEARIRREEERAQKKRETAERKQQEKEARQKKREREKEERLRQKEDERQNKKRQTEKNKQEAGKFSHQEIALLMDSAIYRNSEYDLVKTFEEDFLIEEYPSTLTCNRAIQWIRKDYLDGGAESAVRSVEDRKKGEYEHIPYLLLILEPEEYIPLIRRNGHEEDDDFPNLGKWVQDLKKRWREVWDSQKGPRIILMLNNVSDTLDRMWIDHRKNSRGSTGPSLPNDWELRDSINWLLVQYEIECIQCKTIEQIQSNVHKLTRGLAEAPYAKVISELECVRKIKQDISVGEDPYSKAHDAWLRQLQMIPKVSEARARNLVEHYPTLHSLWTAYHQTQNSSDNISLLNNCFGGKSSQSLLSAAIHRVITCKDPSAMV